MFEFSLPNGLSIFNPFSEPLHFQPAGRVTAWASAFKEEIPMYFLNMHGRPSEKDVFAVS